MGEIYSVHSNVRLVSYISLGSNLGPSGFSAGGEMIKAGKATLDAGWKPYVETSQPHPAVLGHPPVDYYGRKK